MNKCIYTARIAQVAESLLQACYLVEGDRGGAGTRENRGGKREETKRDAGVM